MSDDLISIGGALVYYNCNKDPPPPQKKKKNIAQVIISACLLRRHPFMQDRKPSVSKPEKTLSWRSRHQCFVQIVLGFRL